jgi:hypothetical protein
VPFTMSGYATSAGSEPYQGSMTNGQKIVIAASNASPKSIITRPGN